MQFIDQILDKSLAVAILLECVFFLVELVIFLDFVHLITQLFESRGKALVLTAAKEEKPKNVKAKPLGFLTLYLMSLGAVTYYYLYFFLWAHHPFVKGIGLVYVLIFVLGIVTLLNLVSIILNKISIAHRSKESIIINVVVDLTLLVLLNALYFLN